MISKSSSNIEVQSTQGIQWQIILYLFRVVHTADMIA